VISHAVPRPRRSPVKYNKAIRVVMKRWAQWLERRATSISGQTDAQSEVVDRLVRELKQSAKTKKFHDVLQVEYVSAVGPEKLNAAAMHMSYGYYRYLLCHAHAHIVIGLKHIMRRRTDDLPIQIR